MVNGDAEASPGSTTTTTLAPSGWSVSGTLTAFQYGGGSYADLVKGRDPLSPTPGFNFFAGGAGGVVFGSDVVSTATQTIDLSPYLGEITAGVAQYALSGWLGGWDNQNDNATLTVTFRNSIGVTTGTASIGPLLAADRSNVTGLYYRESLGLVPVGSHSADVVLSMTRNINVGSYNDAYADELNFAVAVPEPGWAPAGMALGLAGFAWGRGRRRRAS